MKNIKLAVLDMAGTTVDEDNVVYKTLRNSVVKYGIEVDLETVLKYGAGKEKLKAITDVLEFLNQPTDKATTIFEDFSIALKNAYEELEVKPIVGVREFLDELRAKNIIVVLNTGYNSKTANQLLEKLGWKKGVQYDALITADDVVNGRPSPEMILKAMELFDIKDSKSVLKAGDSAIDIEEGKNANCGITIGVLSGAQTKEELEEANPDYIFDNITQISSLFVC
ncbi:phosphonatase-like hydrolase [Flavobacterium succinicans]|uniref:Phosphonatase-like hydrolase n=1 Tax=Flavobacterium succinicans TaxID=29536 RepID=A0A1I4YAA1_9FLAO|nr:phosphonatase-like hydrolase [Flavobacterium succinicans]SFN34991.1 phosphonatase-like hydrolase [Flavobacterium succinicans]